MISITRTLLTFLLVGSSVFAQCDKQVVATEIKENKENTIPQIAKDSRIVFKEDVVDFNKVHMMASNYIRTNPVQIDDKNNYFVTLKKEHLDKIYEPLTDQQKNKSLDEFREKFKRHNIRVDIK